MVIYFLGASSWPCWPIQMLILNSIIINRNNSLWKKTRYQSENRLDNDVFSNDLSHTFVYRNRTRFRIHRPSVENSLVLIVASVKYNRGSEKNIENCFFHINLRPGAWTSCNKGVLQKLKRHGNGGSCFKQHEKLKIKIFAERVMESHIYSSIDFYISISKKLFL
jgi:hypothetical protein